MKDINIRLEFLKHKVDQGNIKIMILGLGSVGLYLLDYIISKSDPTISVVVAGRNSEKMESDTNIVKVAALIRKQNKCSVTIDSNCDLTITDNIAKCIKRHNPDFIVNTSRVYSGLKYGSISWHNLRSYGIWTPLAISLIRNIMQACDIADTNAIVINTSYSDVVIPWLKSAGQAYPDFGSGNLNHLIPRIKMAVAQLNEIKDFWNIDVTIATSHFHDVVISKEGQTEGRDPLIHIAYNDKELKVDTDEVYKLCKISMPVDAKRNMMNASSNFDIIFSIIDAIRTEEKQTFHSPGALGLIGGYPVCVDGKKMKAFIDESIFDLDQMVDINKKSIAFDGIESVENGVLTYTDTLLKKTKDAFYVDLPKEVFFNSIDTTANFIIENIIKKSL